MMHSKKFVRVNLVLLEVVASLFLVGRAHWFAWNRQKKKKNGRVLSAIDMNGIKHKYECETGLSQPDAR